MALSSIPPDRLGMVAMERRSILERGGDRCRPVVSMRAMLAAETSQSGHSDTRRHDEKDVEPSLNKIVMSSIGR
jgi:hypothetical protein